ncbi:MalY/PatB family protein [Stomatohabitans albus]|uniref:MalY/PatB family protein n=1 Tax=Stomatohabitans albus TaxID=3110766 RepID=UPI00300C4E45
MINPIHAQWDQISIAHLRDVGGSKWSRFPDHIGCFIAEMDFGIAPEIRDCIIDYASSERHGYLTSPWPQQMAQAFSHFCANRYNWNVNPDLVAPIPDVLSGMEIVVEMLTNPGEPIVVPTPAYMGFFSTLRAIGRPIIEVPSRPEARWAMDFDGIDRALSQGATSVALCNPQNPTGRVYTRQELETLADIVDSHNAIVFNDEIHAPLTYFGHQHIPYPTVSPLAASHSVTATSPSKAWNIPGHRCAQLVFTNQAHYDLFASGPFYRFTDRVPTLGLFTNTVAYASTPTWLPTLIPYLERNIRYLSDAIAAGVWPGVEAGRDYQEAEGTYLAWINLAHTPAAGQPATYLAERANVMGTNGVACGSDWQHFLRLNLGTPHPILTDIIDRIGHVLADS